MENFQISAWAGAGQKVLRSLNLRSEEVERTVLMFLVYTLTSIGLIWLELSTVGLFLDEFGADKMPFIYIASAFIGSGLGLLVAAKNPATEAHRRSCSGNDVGTAIFVSIRHRLRKY